MLFSLCLVSRRFRDIAQPILYHQFVLGYGIPRPSASYSWERRLISFIQTVAQRRDLADHVKKLYIHPNLFQPISNEEAQVTFEQAAIALGVDFSEAWKTRIIDPNGNYSFRLYLREFLLLRYPQRHDDVDLPYSLQSQFKYNFINKHLWPIFLGTELVVILIPLLSRLEHFIFHTSASTTEGIPSLALSALGALQLPIHTIDISVYAAQDYSLSDLDRRIGALVQNTPYLKVLNIHMCSNTWTQDSFPSLPHLEGLRVTHSRLDEDSLGKLLSSCSGLRIFVYEATRPFYIDDVENWRHYSGHKHFQPSEAVKHLKRHCETLTSLHLDLRARGIDLETDGGNIQPISSLKSFNLLEHLFLNSSAICGRGRRESQLDYEMFTNLLPHTIVSLYLPGKLGRVLPRLAKGLLGLANAISNGQFSKLKTVRCDVLQAIDEEEFAVCRAFSSVGVNFAYDSWPLSEAPVPPPSESLLQLLPDDDDPYL